MKLILKFLPPQRFNSSLILTVRREWNWLSCLVINIKIDYEIPSFYHFFQVSMLALPALQEDKCLWRPSINVTSFVRPFLKLPSPSRRSDCPSMHNAKEAKNLKLKKIGICRAKQFLLTTLLIERFTNCLLDSLMITIWLKRKHQKHLNCSSEL